MGNIREGSRGYSLLRGGQFALGFAMGALATVILLMILELVFATSEGVLSISLFSNLGVLTVSLASLLVAYQALREQTFLRQAGTDPVILVHLASREDSRMMITLEVSNVGAGAAMNVEVEFKTDFSQFTPDRILKNFHEAPIGPIRVVPQGKSVSYNFGLGNRLLEDPPIPQIAVIVRYSDINKVSYEDLQTIDVAELKEQRADEPLLARITRAIEKIEKKIERGA